MNAFNTEHIAVREIDAGGPGRGYDEFVRYHTVHACGMTCFRTQTALYEPARNRTMCRECRRSWDGESKAPRRRSILDRHIPVLEKEAAGIRVTVFACGTQAPAQRAREMEHDPSRTHLCTGCRAGTEGPQEDPAYRRAETAREVRRAIKTAVQNPGLPPLVYRMSMGRNGFYRDDGNEAPRGQRILGRASNLMEMAVRACPWRLRRHFICENGEMALRPDDHAVLAESQDPGGTGPGLHISPEDIRAMLPAARESVFRAIGETLEPFGFRLDETGELGQGARKLAQAPRRREESEQ